VEIAGSNPAGATQAQAELDVGETLLADAQALIREARNRAQARRPILMAAIACEVKVKQRLRDLVSAEARKLLDIIIDNPRDVTYQAVALFGKGLEAVCGRSLSKEDRALYSKIDKLFQVRNKIAHEGLIPVDHEEARRLIIGAKRAFDWLDVLPKGSWTPETL
jgi:hypothetical protein